MGGLGETLTGRLERRKKMPGKRGGGENLGIRGVGGGIGASERGIAFSAMAHETEASPHS